PWRPQSVTSPPDSPLQLLGHRPLPPLLSHNPGVSHPLPRPLLHSHCISLQEENTQPPLTLTSPGTALRPPSGMGTPVPLPLNSPAPGRPRNTIMGAFPTTPTLLLATWTQDIAPLHLHTPPLPLQSIQRAKGR